MLRHPLLDKVTGSFTDFIRNSHFFRMQSQLPEDSELEEATYFEQGEMSSYLRQFKKLRAIPDLYNLVQRHVLAPILYLLARDAY